MHAAATDSTVSALVRRAIAALLAAEFAADAMDMRLMTAPSAGTPLTAWERLKLEESRAQFRDGEFEVDPSTRRERPIESAAAR